MGNIANLAVIHKITGRKFRPTTGEYALKLGNACYKILQLISVNFSNSN